MAFAQATESVQQLQNLVTGTVLRPEDAGYEKARWGFALTNDQHPALILIAHDAQDVVAGVNFAREAGLGIAVQATGHGMQHPADDALLIVTTQMKGVEVDVVARTARVNAGVVWKEVLDVVTPHGLAPLLGSSPTVGVIGYTLGGGIGWLARRYGFAADSVRWIEVVTPDGVLRRASATENSDLFWGLRGGGGNFGVVTAMEFDLYPVAALYGGDLMYPAELAAETLRFYREWIKNAPDELTSSITFIRFPPMPQVPEVMRGKLFVVVKAAYVGDAGEGAAWIQKWLDWNTPLNNSFHELPFSEVATISKDPTEPTPGYGSHEMLDSLSDEVIDVMVRRANDPNSRVMFTELRHAGGAISRVPADANALGNRDAQLYMQMGGLGATPEMLHALKENFREYKAELRPYLRGGVYLNFMKGEEADSRSTDAYLPQSYQRLAELKAKYDPNNLFRFSYHIAAS